MTYEQSKWQKKTMSYIPIDGADVRRVIHVAQPDLQAKRFADALSQEEDTSKFLVTQALCVAYCNILEEFARCGMRHMRLTPLCLGENQYLEVLPGMTADALANAFALLGDDAQKKLVRRTVELCVPDEALYGFFADAVITRRAPRMQQLTDGFDSNAANAAAAFFDDEDCMPDEQMQDARQLMDDFLDDPAIDSTDPALPPVSTPPSARAPLPPGTMPQEGSAS